MSKPLFAKLGMFAALAAAAFALLLPSTAGAGPSGQPIVVNQQFCAIIGVVASSVYVGSNGVQVRTPSGNVISHCSSMALVAGPGVTETTHLEITVPAFGDCHIVVSKANVASFRCMA